MIGIGKEEAVVKIWIRKTANIRGVVVEIHDLSVDDIELMRPVAFDMSAEDTFGKKRHEFA